MPGKLRFGCDVDGVLADLLTPIFDHLSTRFDLHFTIDHMSTWDVSDLIPEELRTPFWKSFGEEVRVHDILKPLPGALEGMRRLREVADVYLVTSHLRSAPTWVHDRDKWLEEHFEISGKKIIHTSAKYIFGGAALIDDKPENVKLWQEEHPNARGILWDQPYNREAVTRSVLTADEIVSKYAPGAIAMRTSSWEGVYNLAAGKAFKHTTFLE